MVIRLLAVVLLASLVAAPPPPVVVAEDNVKEELECARRVDCHSCLVGRDQGKGNHTQGDRVKCRWCLSSSLCGHHNSGDCEGKVWSEYNCPAKKKPHFDESFVTKIVMPLVGATHGFKTEQVQACLDQVRDTRLVHQYFVHCEHALARDVCSGYLAVNPSKQLIIVAFRASLGWLQKLAQGFEFLFNIMTPSPWTGGRVIKYYERGVRLLWEAGMERQLRELREQHRGYKIVVIGHSLGGALASVASTRIVAELGHTNIRLITLGQPRTGDRTFAEGVERLVPHHWRIVHDRDNIPNLPPQLPIERDPPHHFRFGVWYQMSMAPHEKFRICAQAEDPECQASALAAAENHTTYYQVHLPSWYLRQCEPLHR